MALSPPTSADSPINFQISALRGRKELNIERLKRPVPEGVALIQKQEVAAEFIKEEHEIFGDQQTEMLDEGFEASTRSDRSRKLFAADILKGMLIRGRLQAAVFDIFLQLCRQGVCSLSALEHPVDWHSLPEPKSCLSRIYRMLALFEYSQKGSYRGSYILQNEWGISHSRWEEYCVPKAWLAIMIGRSFTSLDAVFHIIRSTGQLGQARGDKFRRLVEDFQPDQTWEADINLKRWRSPGGDGTFASWLPVSVDTSLIQQGFEKAAIALSIDFYYRLEKTEMHYAIFFDISREVFDADVEQETISQREIWAGDDESPVPWLFEYFPIKRAWLASYLTKTGYIK